MFDEAREGNLVQHLSGGPIMVVTQKREAYDGYVYECTWVENRQKRIGWMKSAELRGVYADGSPRMYGKE